MSSYLADSERHCSGYDEYEGIFGPLATGASLFSSRQARQRDGYFPSYRTGGRTGPSRRHARQAPPSFDRRAKYLASRSDKRRQRQLGIYGGNISPSEDGEGPAAAGRTAPTLTTVVRGKAAMSERQQVWLPTRSFTFRQRSGKLDTRAIARLDLEKIAATTDIEAIQRHLENLTFADVTLDDVQQYSDAYFLKLFQIAQLTLEYLMHVQDSLVDHSESLESQCEQLLDECQQLEVDNDKQETEIASLKRDIRQKQRTMATFELMLLNASSRKLPAAVNAETPDKENVSKGANALVEELLTSSIEDEGDGGLGVQPIECVLCEKRFVSVDYLLRHQEKKHQRKHRRSGGKAKKKRSPSSSASSGSSASSSSERRSSRRKQPEPLQVAVSPSPASLPKEVLDALEEKNQLARQLVELQSQVRAEQEARDSKRRQIGAQQTYLASQVMEHLGQLQSALAAIEKKQEAVKHDMIKHTEDAIKRMQDEAAEASRRARQSISRVGALESDQEGSAVHPVGASTIKSAGAEWSQLEKVMDTFLRAQALKQQEIDALQQQNAKLTSKVTKRSKQRRDYPEVPTTLLAMAALDAARFGVDYGQISANVQVSRATKRTDVDEKTVQTDDEEMKPMAAVRVDSDAIQTDQTALSKQMPRKTVIQVRSSRSNMPVMRQSSPDTSPPTRAIHQPASAKVVSSQAADRDASIRGSTACETAQRQAAARVVVKTVLRFLRSKQLAKQSSWRFVVLVSRLEQSLHRAALARIRSRHGDEVCLQITRGMTANRLRCVIADTLSGGGSSDSVKAFDLQDAEDDDIDEGGAGIMVDRVLLRHQGTGVELRSETLQIHLFEGELEVEILPREADVLENKAPAVKMPQNPARGVTRLQAQARGFIARRKFQVMKNKSRRAAEAGKMEAPLSVPLFGSDRDISPANQLDEMPSRLSAQCEIIRQRLSAAVLVRLTSGDCGADTGVAATSGRSKGGSDDSDRLSAKAVTACLANVDSDRKKFSDRVQERIEQLEARLDTIVPEEMVLLSADNAECNEQQQLQSTRRRLDELLSGIRTSKSAQAREQKTLADQPRALLNEFIACVFPQVQTEVAVDRKEIKPITVAEQRAPARRESADSSEIRALADAYEHDESGSSTHQTKTAPSKIPTVSAASLVVNGTVSQQPISRLRHAERSVAVVARAIPVVAAASSTTASQGGRPGTPTPEPDSSADSGRESPPPEVAAPTSKMISPFSKTPLISRRARRGTGFENAR